MPESVGADVGQNPTTGGVPETGDKEKAVDDSERVPVHLTPRVGGIDVEVADSPDREVTAEKNEAEASGLPAKKLRPSEDAREVRSGRSSRLKNSSRLSRPRRPSSPSNLKRAKGQEDRQEEEGGEEGPREGYDVIKVQGKVQESLGEAQEDPERVDCQAL